MFVKESENVAVRYELKEKKEKETSQRADVERKDTLVLEMKERWRCMNNTCTTVGSMNSNSTVF